MSPFAGVNELVDRFCSKEAIGVEIGVHHAETTLFLMKNEKVGHLYAIDPYVDRDKRYRTVMEQLEPYTNCTLVRKTSHNASDIVPDYLDFVFIDGDHSYEAVLTDLCDWVPKIRPGGLLLGHDWRQSREHAGVIKAGIEYFQENNSLFESLISNEELREMGMAYEITAGCIHKQLKKKYPLWWRIKLENTHG